jgi:hypothetical protein
VAELAAHAVNASPTPRCVGYKVDSRRYLRSADWLVLTSRAEGMPLSVLEAFAERVPVIATDIPERDAGRRQTSTSRRARVGAGIGGGARTGAGDAATNSACATRRTATFSRATKPRDGSRL